MTYRVVLIALLGVISLAGCIPTERELRMDHELGTLGGRVAVLERNLAGQTESQTAMDRLSKELRGELDGTNKRQADLQARQEALRVELQTLRGQIDDTAARRREQQESQALTQQDWLQRLGNLESRIDRLEKENAELRANLAKVVEQPASRQTGETEGEKLYDQGRDLIQNQKNPVQGRALLEDFIKQRPRSELVPNALYWIGEAYYSEKNFESAILQFQDVLDKYPTDNKASAALYKQALAFQALNEPKKARALLQKLTEVYPKSGEAEKAREQLAKKTKPPSH